MYFFTADEHYNHAKIIEYCDRPFSTVEEMNEALISYHNHVVGCNDITVHAGDFAFGTREEVEPIIKRLNGNHIFVKGSHDRWLGKNYRFMWRKMIEDQFVVVCHYAMRKWERGHHGSWQLYGHSHGRCPPVGLQWDVGVDCNGFTPLSFEKLKTIMSYRSIESESYFIYEDSNVDHLHTDGDSCI